MGSYFFNFTHKCSNYTKLHYFEVLKIYRLSINTWQLTPKHKILRGSMRKNHQKNKNSKPVYKSPTSINSTIICLQSAIGVIPRFCCSAVILFKIPHQNIRFFTLTQFSARDSYKVKYWFPAKRNICRQSARKSGNQNLKIPICCRPV